jgi:hypothetical protein
MRQETAEGLALKQSRKEGIAGGKGLDTSATDAVLAYASANRIHEADPDL